MENLSGSGLSELFGSIGTFFRKCIFRVLAVGPIPNHIAFIMDGNRRFARNRGLKEGAGHRIGFLALLSILQYCYEMGVKCVTIYAFSIDNFNRRPDEVQYVMDLMQEKIEGLLKEVSIVNLYEVRVRFLGNLKLLHEPVRLAAEKAMAATAGNTKALLLVCVAYTSTDEIVHAVQKAYDENHLRIQDCPVEVEDLERKMYFPVDVGDLERKIQDCPVEVGDLERKMYFGGYPDPDILIRTSGETRLSNFILWQSNFCYLHAPRALWPEIALRHLVWAVLEYQRIHPYLEKQKRKIGILNSLKFDVY